MPKSRSGDRRPLEAAASIKMVREGKITRPEAIHKSGTGPLMARAVFKTLGLSLMKIIARMSRPRQKDAPKLDAVTLLLIVVRV